jgi:hypothetical protein
MDARMRDARAAVPSWILPGRTLGDRLPSLSNLKAQP